MEQCEADPGFFKLCLRQFKFRYPARVFAIGRNMPGYAGLNSHGRTSSTSHKRPCVKRAIIQRLLGEQYGVALAVDEHLVLDLAVVQALWQVFDSLRQPVVADRYYASFLVYNYRTGLRAWILGPA